MTQSLSEKLQMLPDSPGCYLMKEAGEILYVGKAVNLKNRVRSYFHGSGHSAKVAALVRRVDDFDILLCDTNLEALILECNLIKLHKPYYNILLKDDKHYPYIRIDENEAYPRAEVVRRVEKDGARYFGPYYGTYSIREVLDVLRKTFPLRTCARPPDPSKPRRPCVQHEIGMCPAPCAGKTTPEKYAANVREVISFLGGGSKAALSRLRDEMEKAAAELKFERAAALRDRIRDVERLTERQLALSTVGGERDVIAIAQDGLDAMAQVLRIRGGRLIGGDSFALERAGDEEIAAVIESFLMQYYEDGALLPREVLAEALEHPETVEAALTSRRGARVHLTVPKRGEKRALVLMAKKNALDALEKRNARARQSYERTLGAAKALAEAIGLEEAPRRIEGFDISNTQGAQSVASMVVFIDGAPAKREYRHFRIKTVQGANDFASMEEVLGRRFKRGLSEEAGAFSDLPDLILIDGGPEQLLFARRAMLASGADVPMFGLAKKLEEIWLPGAETPILLDRHSPALHLIQRLRDEAHRFAITHHRALRAKHAVGSKLETIPGVGARRRTALLKHFKSMEALRAATVDEIAAVRGMSRPAAEAVYAFFHAEASDSESVSRTAQTTKEGSL